MSSRYTKTHGTFLCYIFKKLFNLWVFEWRLRFEQHRIKWGLCCVSLVTWKCDCGHENPFSNAFEMTWASKKQGQYAFSLEERGIGKWLKISVPQSVSATKKIKAQMVIYSFEIEKPLKHSRNFTSFFEERLIFFGFTQPSSKAASVWDLEMLFINRLARKVTTWSLGIKTVIYFPENPQYLY